MNIRVVDVSKLGFPFFATSQPERRRNKKAGYYANDKYSVNAAAPPIHHLGSRSMTAVQPWRSANRLNNSVNIENCAINEEKFVVRKLSQKSDWSDAEVEGKRSKEDGKEQSLKLVWAWRVSDFIFLASACECGQSSLLQSYHSTNSVW